MESAGVAFPHLDAFSPAIASRAQAVILTAALYFTLVFATAFIFGVVRELANASLEEIRNTPELLTFALAQGRTSFADNCAPCHGQGGGGAKGYPNLNDDDWLWGGTLAQIETTIRFGARATNDKGHQGSMPAFGRDGMLKRPEVLQVSDYDH